jgi:phosphatidylserine/phosphatidylglycerophosphate/cardiolipin synthase-like enzyme
VYFSPRTDGDTEVSILDNVQCDATSRIRVAMAFFTDARVAVAQRLAARRRDGCNVQVVVGDADSTTHRRLVFTGSHNWTGPALTINDETLLWVENDGVFDAYLADWPRVRTAAMRP